MAFLRAILKLALVLRDSRSTVFAFFFALSSCDVCSNATSVPWKLGRRPACPVALVLVAKRFPYLAWYTSKSPY